MKYVFIGDPNADGGDKTESATCDGVFFPLNQPVSVSHELADKLKGHSHFKQVFEDAKKPEPVKPNVGNTHPLDGKTKDELEIIGRKYGIEVDRRRKLSSIKRQVAEAMNAHND